jgi:hypothetical protein
VGRVAHGNTLVRVTAVPAATRSVAFPRTTVRAVLRAGPFPAVPEAWYGLTVTDAQGNLALTLLSTGGRTLARCRYPHGTYPYVPFTQTTVLACRLRDPAELGRVVVTATDEPRGLAVLAAGAAGALTGGYLLQPQPYVEHQSAAEGAVSRMSAARPAAFGGTTFLVAAGLSVAAVVLAAALALPARRGNPSTD